MVLEVSEASRFATVAATKDTSECSDGARPTIVPSMNLTINASAYFKILRVVGSSLERVASGLASSGLAYIRAVLPAPLARFRSDLALVSWCNIPGLIHSLLAI